MTSGTCAVVHPNLSSWQKTDERKAARPARAPSACLEEAVSLAGAIELEVCHSEWIDLPKPRPATLLGKGTVERLAGVLETLEGCDLVIVNVDLSPVQQRNLEKHWNRKVIDRTGLILEIFGARARTGEGRLQVELAALNYQLGRLVRSWTHLERQRGGAGFMGGPGERQIELDRRLIRQRIARLKKQLAEVKRTRSLQRRARRRVPYPVVAIVGYTNAGKSTLFNRLTGADVLAKDQLFATLDPTMRRFDLPDGGVAILSDTVGFVSDLPHELVNAFHATLEEVIEADLILHLRDIADPDSEIQRDDVLSVLSSLGLADTQAKPMLEVLNKTDLLDPASLLALRNRVQRQDNQPPILVSAATGEGCDAIALRVEDLLGAVRSEIDVTVGFEDGATLSWIYRNGRVISRDDTADGVRLRVSVDEKARARLSNRIDSGPKAALEHRAINLQCILLP